MKEVLCREVNEDPVLFGPQQLVSSTKLVRNMSSYLNLAQKKPIFIERDQEVEAVIVSIDTYRELLLEEKKAKEMYLSVRALKRLAEHLKSGEEALNFKEVFKKYLSEEDMAGVK